MNVDKLPIGRPYTTETECVLWAISAQVSMRVW